CFRRLSTPPRAQHSFPTRRSSDLPGPQPPDAPGGYRSESPREIETVMLSTSTMYWRVATALNLQGRLKRGVGERHRAGRLRGYRDRKSTRLNSSHVKISYAVFCLK